MLQQLLILQHWFGTDVGEAKANPNSDNDRNNIDIDNQLKYSDGNNHDNSHDDVNGDDDSHSNIHKMRTTLNDGIKTSPCTLQEQAVSGTECSTPV